MLVRLNADYRSPAFQRKPNAAEMKQYARTVSDGLNVLGKKVGLIVHNSSVPSAAKKNLGVGSLLSKNAELAFIPFLAVNAISTIQQEPNNLRSASDPSPYCPQSNAKNIYMIPVERLATEEYNNLLAKEDIQKIIDNNQKRTNYNTVNYNQLLPEYNRILGIAYENLMKKDSSDLLKKEFEDFKSANYDEYEPMAVYEVLATKNNNDSWKNWNETERNLYMSSDKTALNDIVNRNKLPIDFFMFKQWILEKEIAKSNERNKELGISVIGDSPVAFTPVEVWMNQDLFFEDYALGCPPDDYCKDGQRWGFAYIKPEKMFNPDGTLGPGGELMKKRYEKMFQASPGGVRIDHIIGLIDPHIYSTKEPVMNSKNSGRLFSEPMHEVFGQYAKSTYAEHAEIIEKIVIPAAAKFGLTKDDIICEDLGTVTEPVRHVMNKLGLSGIAITQYDYRGKDTPEKNIIMPGSHDNESMVQYTDKMFSYGERRHLEEKTQKLADDTIVPGENWGNYRYQMMNDKKKFLSASFAELFTSPAKKVQLFFTTFFGMNRTYNQPGTTEGCWTLRIPENYEDMYWDNVKNGTAINLPEVIARAIRNKGDDFSKHHRKLLGKLDEFTQILKS